MKLLCLLLLLFFCAHVPAQNTIVKVNWSNNSPNETTIYINPTDSMKLIAASNIDNLYLSHDGGKTWMEDTLRSSLGVYGDPVVYIDAEGNYYFCHLSRTKGFDFPNFIDRIVVQKSLVHGNRFNQGVGVGFNKQKVQDKHWIISDNSSSRFRGNLYLSWTEFDKYGSRDTSHHSRIRFSRSEDKGESFSEAITISDTVGDCVDSDSTLEGATPAVTPDGKVHIAWSGHGNIYYDRSSDGGRTFGKDKVIAKQSGSWDIPIKRIYRSNGMPFISCDNSKGKYRGNLYVNFSDTRNGDADIFCLRSGDGGKTWSQPIRVNNDERSNGKDQFMSHMTVDQRDGTIYILFYDRRHSAHNVFLDVYLGISVDGGMTFINRRVTNASFPPPGDNVFFGDYIGVAALGGMVRPIWTDVVGKNLEIKAALLDKKHLLDTVHIKPLSVSARLLPAEEKAIVHLYLPEGKSHELIVFQKDPRKFNVLSDGPVIFGDHELVIKLNNYSKGIYYLQLTVDGVKAEAEFLVE